MRQNVQKRNGAVIKNGLQRDRIKRIIYSMWLIVIFLYIRFTFQYDWQTRRDHDVTWRVNVWLTLTRMDIRTLRKLYINFELYASYGVLT